MFTKTELQRERIQLEAKYSAAMNTAEKYRRAIEGLDALVAVVSDGVEGVVSEPQEDAAPLGPVVSKVISMIDEIHIERSFTLRDVMTLLESIGDTDTKKKTVSQVLRSLADDDVIELVEAGKGRRPSVYKRRQGLAFPAPHAA